MQIHQKKSKPTLDEAFENHIKQAIKQMSLNGLKEQELFPLKLTNVNKSQEELQEQTSPKHFLGQRIRDLSKTSTLASEEEGFDVVNKTDNKNQNVNTNTLQILNTPYTRTFSKEELGPDQERFCWSQYKCAPVTRNISVPYFAI